MGHWRYDTKYRVEYLISKAGVLASSNCQKNIKVFLWQIESFNFHAQYFPLK